MEIGLLTVETAVSQRVLSYSQRKADGAGGNTILHRRKRHFCHVCKVENAIAPSLSNNGLEV